MGKGKREAETLGQSLHVEEWFVYCCITEEIKNLRDRHRVSIHWETKVNFLFVTYCMYISAP